MIETAKSVTIAFKKLLRVISKDQHQNKYREDFFLSIKIYKWNVDFKTTSENIPSLPFKVSLRHIILIRTRFLV